MGEVETALTILETIGKYTVAPIKRHLGYLISCNKKVEELEKEVEKLGHMRERVEHSVDEAERKGEEIYKDVKKWLEDEVKIVTEANNLIEDASKAKTSCSNWRSYPNLKSRHQFGRKASKMAPTVSNIEKVGNSLYEKGVSYVVAQGIGNSIEELRKQVQKLIHMKQRVQHSVDAAKRRGERIEEDVEKWLETEEGITAEANKLIEDVSNAEANKLIEDATSIEWEHQLSGKVSNMAVAVSKIEEEGNSLIDKGVSYVVAPQGIGNTSIKGYEAFDSRMSTVKGVIEALKSDTINMIGVYGMGGIGKTMLVKEVARQVKQDKLFDKVVMTVVSQTPNIKEIQRAIFNMLDLHFDTEESIERRAERLGRKLLKKEESKLGRHLKSKEKILVIIDDIWGKLDLEAVGLSFGNDQKKCKLLFTSRFEDVLRKDMDIQNIFHLGVLSHDESRKLFREIVGSLAEDQAFHPVAVDVVKECAGLPIAITAVANALKGEKLPVWEDAMQQLRASNLTNIKGMPNEAYNSIKLSYDFLRSEEAKSLLLLCSLHKEDANINVDSLLRYGMGLDLFQNVYRLESVRNRVYTLVEILKSSCLLLNGDIDDTVKMHDIIRDVAIHIAANCKDKRMLVIGNADNLQEWSKKKKLKDSTAISLPYTNVCELPERLESPQLC